MDADIIVSLDRLKKRRQLWEKLDEEDGAVDQSDDELDDRQIMTRRFYEREGHKKSFWYQFVHERDLTDLNGRDGKLFRNRFTVPYPLYLQLLVLAERWFPQKKYDEGSIPTRGWGLSQMADNAVSLKAHSGRRQISVVEIHRERQERCRMFIRYTEKKISVPEECNHMASKK
jgi:hypothetical protein